jgi:hypothetical protein
MLSNVQHPTSAPPTGPTRTTAARLAMLAADQARLRDRSTVAVDSETISSRPSAATCAQSIPVNGPTAMTTTAAVMTAQI